MEAKRVKTKMKELLISRAGLVLLLSIIAIQLPAQKVWDERKGCISAQGNLAPGYLFAQKTVSAYVNGDIE